MTDIHVLDHNPIDSNLTFTYERKLHMAKREYDGLRLTEYIPMRKRWIPIPIVSHAGQALCKHLLENSLYL